MAKGSKPRRRGQWGLSAQVLNILDTKPRMPRNVTRYAGGRGSRKMGRRVRSLGFGLPLTLDGMGQGSTRRTKRGRFTKG